MKEYVIKLVKVSLAIFYNSCKNKRGKPFDKSSKNIHEALTEANVNEIINA